MKNVDYQPILVDQQAELGSITSTWCEREQTETLKSYLSSKLIKVVMGIRRAGKSTLCLSVLPPDEIAYVNFDDERLVSLETADLNVVYETLLKIKPHARLFVFDEIQNVASWELFLNRLNRKKLNILITGSNGRLLSRDLASHLTGRQLSLELMPFSFSEYLRLKKLNARPGITEDNAKLKRLMQEYFSIGGFPEVVLGEMPGPYLRELFDKIVSRDIAQRYQLRGVKALKQLGLYLIQNSSCAISLEKLRQTFDFRSINTVRSYIDHLQDCYLVYELSAYSHKLKERNTSPKKIYACDLGMISALDAKPTPDLGSRLETLVFLHLRQQTRQLHYLKHGGHEVDFAIIENRKIVRLIQVCYSMESDKTRKREISALIASCKHYGLANAQIITWDQAEVFSIDGIEMEAIPAWRFLIEAR